MMVLNRIIIFNKSQIINDYLYQTHPNILFGGAENITPAQASGVGYTVVITDT